MLPNNRIGEMLVNSDMAMTSQASMAMIRKSHYSVDCYDANGVLKWHDEFDNLVTYAGLSDSLQQHFKGSAYTALWYVGITSGSVFAQSDTMASHPGWTEATNYSQASRPVLTLGAVSSGITPATVDNSASKAVFSINGSGNVFGAFLTTGSVIGTSGSTGTLYGEGLLASGMRSVQNLDSLSITLTLTAA
jgi:hypothetical protein